MSLAAGSLVRERGAAAENKRAFPRLFSRAAFPSTAHFLMPHAHYTSARTHAYMYMPLGSVALWCWARGCLQSDWVCEWHKRQSRQNHNPTLRDTPSELRWRTLPVLITLWSTVTIVLVLRPSTFCSYAMSVRQRGTNFCSNMHF